MEMKADLSDTKETLIEDVTAPTNVQTMIQGFFIGAEPNMPYKTEFSPCPGFAVARRGAALDESRGYWRRDDKTY